MLIMLAMSLLLVTFLQIIHADTTSQDERPRSIGSVGNSLHQSISGLVAKAKAKIEIKPKKASIDDEIETYKKQQEKQSQSKHKEVKRKTYAEQKAEYEKKRTKRS